MGKRNRGEVQVFSLSFLDVLSCALGGVVLLLLLAIRNNDQPEFWVFSIDVHNLVNADKQRTPVDWKVNYYAALDFNGAEVSGSLLGVEDLTKDTGMDSFGQAEIKGTRTGDEVTFDLLFTGGATGDIERITGTLEGGCRMKGRLSVVAISPSHNGYEGVVDGVKLTP